MTQAKDMPHYQILVEGVLDSSWSECLAGMKIAAREEPGQPIATELTGPLTDQAALQGVLDALFMLNMRLVLVRVLPS